MKIIKIITVFSLTFFGSLAVGVVLGAFITGQSLAAMLNEILSLSIVESMGIPLLSIFAMCLAVVAHTILHEAGHLIFGLASGYKFLSFRILSLAFVKEDGRMKTKRYTVAGTLGQCLMSPPKISANHLPVVGYNLGGVVMNLLLSAAFGVAICFCKGYPIVAIFCTMFVLVGIFLIIVNGIPMIVGGIPNDGMNALRLRRNATSRKAFALLLKTNAMVQNGIRPRDLGDELFLSCEDVDYSEPLQVNSQMAYAAKLLDGGDLDGALALNREIIEKAGKVKIMAFEAKCEAASILLLQGKIVEAKAMLNQQEMKQVGAYAKSMSSKQRLLFLLALKADNDREKAQEIYDHCLQRRNSYMMRGEVEMDIDLMQKALTNCPPAH